MANTSSESSSGTSRKDFIIANAGIITGEVIEREDIINTTTETASTIAARVGLRTVEKLADSMVLAGYLV